MESSLAASQGMAAGYVFNINLPDWKSQTPRSQETAEELARKKRSNQNLIAFVVLAVLVGAIIYFKKKK